MRILVVDDDFAVRKLLTVWLKTYGDCDTAVNGKEAVQAVRMALTEGSPYEIICLDIMMPGMNGLDALKAIRELEAERNIYVGKGSKVIMTTAAANPKSIMGAFKEQCEAYLIKPLDKNELYNALKKLGFDAPSA